MGSDTQETVALRSLLSNNGRHQEEDADLVKKAQQLEVELDKTKEELMQTTEKLKEKENALLSAELGVNALNRRVQGLEEDLEKCEDKLLVATNKLDKAATAA